MFGPKTHNQPSRHYQHLADRMPGFDVRQRGCRLLQRIAPINARLEHAGIDQPDQFAQQRPIRAHEQVVIVDPSGARGAALVAGQEAPLRALVKVITSSSMRPLGRTGGSS